MSIVAVIPAAGVGKRMGADRPKQYLPLLDSTVLEQTLQCVDEMPFVSAIVISISDDDPYWASLNVSLSKPLIRVSGGAERVHSVANAVAHVVEQEMGGWIMVHDAARPCVRLEDVEKLIRAVDHHECGGILGMPVRDTMKQVGHAGDISATVDRFGLWHAFTPQLFRASLLHEALQAGLANPEKITDEASAIEALGYRPLMVEGASDNLKITRPEDLALASFYLQQRRG